MTDLVVTGKLTVDGTSDLKQKLTVLSDSFFLGFLRVGALAAVGYNVLAIADVQGNLGVGGDTILTGNLTVNGANGVSSLGPVIIDDILRTNAPHGIVCGGPLSVANAAKLQQGLTVKGSLAVTGNSTSVPICLLDTDLTVAGTSTFSGNSVINGTLNVTGVTALNTSLTLTGSLAIGGDTVFQNITVNGGDGVLSEGPVVVNDILRTNVPTGIVCGGTISTSGKGTFQEDVVVSNHLVGAGPVPQLAVSFFTGFQGVPDPDSSDTAGAITITNVTGTATSAIAIGNYISIRYGRPWAKTPILTMMYGPGNLGTGQFQITEQSTTQFTLTCTKPTNAIPVGQSLVLNWVCISSN